MALANTSSELLVGSSVNPQLDDDNWEVIVKFNGDLTEIGKTLNAQVEVLYLNYAILTLNRSKIPDLYAFPQIEHIELPKNLSFVSSFHLISTCVKSVQENPPFELDGDGVLVAVIDSGIDYTHSDFRNEDGTTRILSIWDQTAAGTPPAGFFSGAEYDSTKLNQALKSDNPFLIVPNTDPNGHGTAVAGVAVGNGRASSGENQGVAPKAEIISVRIGTRGLKSFARTTELMRAVKYVISKAMEVQKPLAINISFGNNYGSHLGDTLFETYLSDISSLWKTVIVVPTGNEGSAGHHYAGKIASRQTQEIDFFTAAGISGFFISLWKQFVDNFSVEIIFPNGRSSGVLNIESQVKTVAEEEEILTMIYGQPNRYSVNQEIYFEVRARGVGLSAGLWKLRIIAEKIVSGEYQMWLPTVEEVTDETFFSNAAEDNTLTIPSTADNLVVVSGYNDRLGNIAEFSGRGNANLALPNPDLAAPAVSILSTAVGGGYDSFTGTSIAAPFVTGAAALMMQWGITKKNDPFLYGERIKAFLRMGANRVDTMQYPNNTFGFGTLCLNGTMKALEQYQLGVK